MGLSSKIINIRQIYDAYLTLEMNGNKSTSIKINRGGVLQGDSLRVRNCFHCSFQILTGFFILYKILVMPENRLPKIFYQRMLTLGIMIRVIQSI